MERLRSKLPRSAGSFSVIEEKIVVPTPRKAPLSSPCVLRREKRKNSEESVFGAAGMELQSILFSQSSSCTSVESETPEIPEREAGHIFFEEHMEDDCVQNWPFYLQHPPTRASNPIILNSPFQHELADRNFEQTAFHKDSATKHKPEKSKSSIFRPASWHGENKGIFTAIVSN